MSDKNAPTHISVHIKLKVDGPKPPNFDKIKKMLEKKYQGGPYVYEGWALVQCGLDINAMNERKKK